MFHAKLTLWPSSLCHVDHGGPRWNEPFESVQGLVWDEWWVSLCYFDIWISQIVLKITLQYNHHSIRYLRSFKRRWHRGPGQGRVWCATPSAFAGDVGRRCIWQRSGGFDFQDWLSFSFLSSNTLRIANLVCQPWQCLQLMKHIYFDSCYWRLQSSNPGCTFLKPFAPRGSMGAIFCVIFLGARGSATVFGKKNKRKQLLDRGLHAFFAIFQ